MLRAGYSVDVVFFEDDETPIRINWYMVPKNTPFIPFPHMGSQVWDWEGGYRSNLFRGFVDGIQGEQWGSTPFYGKGPRPLEQYTGNFCGTRSQWGGDLRADRQEDIGFYGCCGLPGEFIACVCSNVTTTIAVPISRDFLACSCAKPAADVTGSPEYDYYVCDCTYATVEYYQAPNYELYACSCSYASVELSEAPTYDFTACSCSTPTLAALLAPSVDGLACNCTYATIEVAEEMPTTFTCESIVAAGTVQADATPITADNCYVTGADFTTGVILPSGCYRIAVVNDSSGMGAGNLNVYPPVGETIYGLPTNSPYSLTFDIGVTFVSYGTGLWFVQ